MKLSEYKKIIAGLMNPETGIIDEEKCRQLDEETKNKLVHQFVKLRVPVLKALIHENFDTSWIHSMGYMYPAQSPVGLELLCTCENRPKSF